MANAMEYVPDQDFGQVFGMLEQGKDNCEWCKLLDDGYAHLAHPADLKFDKGFDKMEKDKRNLVFTMTLDEEYIMDPPSKILPRGMEIKYETSAFLTMLQDFKFVARREFLPIAGVGGFYQCVKGHISIHVFAVQEILDYQHTLETIADFLQGIDGTMLSKRPGVYLTSGKSIWVPTGYVPVIIGVGVRGAALLKENAVSACMVYPILDNKGVANLDGPVRTEIKSWIEKGLTAGLHVFKGATGMAIGKWLETWKDIPTLPEPSTMSKIAEGSSVEVPEQT